MMVYHMKKPPVDVPEVQIIDRCLVSRYNIVGPGGNASSIGNDSYGCVPVACTCFFCFCIMERSCISQNKKRPGLQPERFTIFYAAANSLAFPVAEAGTPVLIILTHDHAAMIRLKSGAEKIFYTLWASQ